MLNKINHRTNSPDRAASVENSQAADDAEAGNADKWVPAEAGPDAKGNAKLSVLLRVLIQITLMVLILFGSFLAMNRLINTKPEIQKPPSFRTVYTVETVPVVLGDNRPKFTVYGEAVASRTVELRSLVSGEVIWINEKLKTGARVQKGDNLVEIDDFQFKGALREAQANRDEALARIKENESRIRLEKAKLKRLTEQLELARVDYQRISGLRANGTSTQKQLDDRAMSVSQRAQAAEQTQNNLQAENAKLEQQNASLARLNWRVELAERNLINTMLKAPFDGVVRTTGAEVGRSINANDVVVSLYEDRKMDIRFTLTDKRYGRLQRAREGVLGREVKIIWAIGSQQFTYPATIERIGAEIASSRGGVEVLASLQQVAGNPAIRPGAFVEIQVPDISFVKSAIVPESAIYHGDTVYLMQDGKLAAQIVEVLAYDSGSTIISGNIQNDDRILITRIAEISDGLRVREEGKAKINKNADIANKKNGKGN